MHFGSTSRPCRDTPGAGELSHRLMRQVGAKSRGLGDVAWPNYVPAALLRGSERLGTVTRHHQWVEGTLRRPRNEAAGADIKPLVDLVRPIGESPAVWLISGRRSLKLERFHEDAPTWSAADYSTLDRSYGARYVG